MKFITEEKIQQAVEVLKRGGVVAYPTDTSYGLAVDVTNSAAVSRLYRLKGRGFDRPIHVIPPDLSYVAEVAKISRTIKKLTDKYWPGPLTVVLPLKVRDPLLERIRGERGLGFRQPDNKVALRLAQALGKPISATSANVSGKPDNYTVTGIKRQFQGKRKGPDFYLDAGRLTVVKPSTIVYIEKKRVTIIRQGPISETAILRALLK